MVREQAYRSLYGKGTFLSRKMGDFVYYYGFWSRSLPDVTSCIKKVIIDDVSGPPPEVSLINELIDARDGSVYVPGLSVNELGELLLGISIS